jgi:hypothetical protein
LPRTFDLVPTVALLAFLILSLAWSGDRSPPWTWQTSVATTLIVVGLLAVDRVEYLQYGETTPTWLRLAFVALRLVLCGLYVLVARLDIYPVLLALAQYAFFISYGRTWGLGALAAGWSTYLAAHAWWFLLITGNAELAQEMRDLIVGRVGIDVGDGQESHLEHPEPPRPARSDSGRALCPRGGPPR